MYKHYSAQEFKANLGLPKDYNVSGMLVFGGWNKPKYQLILEQKLKSKNIDFELKEMDNFLGGITEIRILNKIFWFSVCYGGALLSEYLHLTCLFGSQKNILIGSCGGLNKNIKAGDFIVPEFSFGSESTTRMYQPQNLDHKYFSNKELNLSISRELSEESQIFTGPVTTCQAMLAESWENVMDWSASGFDGVDMESSTMFSVSNHFNVASSAILYVMDNLIEKQSVLDADFGSTIEIRKNSISRQYEVALNELIKPF